VKTLLLASVAALLMATSAAHADEKWEGDFRKCQLTKRFSEAEGMEGITQGKFFLLKMK
jgi:opacity protein-like surface antigen